MIVIMRYVIPWLFYTLMPRQNDQHFADDIFKIIFLYKIHRIMIPISQKLAEASNQQ